MRLNCDIQIPSVEGLEDGVLTVGRIFNLDCKSSEGSIGDLSKSQLELAAEQKFALQLLKVKNVSDQQVQLEMTSYKVGEWKFEKIQLKQEDRLVELAVPPITVKTVIDQQEKPEMFGPIGPLRIPWPWLYIGILLAIVLYLIGVISLKVRRYMQRKALLAHLQDFETAMAPLQQFHAQSRKWQRDYAFFHTLQGSEEEMRLVLQDIDRLVRVYFIRKFKIPAHQWGRKLILRELRKEYRSTYKVHGALIQKWFNEIEKALNGTTKQKAEDIVQLHNQARKLLEKLDHDGASQQKGLRTESKGLLNLFLDILGLG